MALRVVHVPLLSRMGTSLSRATCMPSSRRQLSMTVLNADARQRHGNIEQQQQQRRWLSASGTQHSSDGNNGAASCSGLSPRPPLPPLGYILLPKLDYLTGLELQQHLVDRQLRLRKSFQEQQQQQQQQHQGEGEKADPLVQPPPPSPSPNNDVLLLVEHTPVYTNGRRNRGDKAVGAQEVQRLQALGADYVETLRGGEITFHGPGQLVAYPILDIKQADLSVRCYVSYLEKAIIATCARLGISAKTTEHTGVWVTDTKKIAAIGVHVQRYITSHGLALNCSTDLGFFDTIVACGLTGKQTTSITKEKHERLQQQQQQQQQQQGQGGVQAAEEQWDVQKVLPHFVDGFAQVFQRQVVPLAQINPALEEEIRAFRRKSVA